MLGLTTLALVATMAGSAQDQDFRWSGSLAAGKTLEVAAVNGRISATPARGNQVEVTATKTARRSDPASVTIKVEEHEGGVRICTLAPGNADGSCRGDRGRRGNSWEDNDVSVAFEVRLPAAVVFRGTVVNGPIEASDLASEVHLTTVNGGVDVSTSGFAEATSVNGDVTVRMGRSDWDGSAEYSSVNGNVTVTLPAGTNADVRASTVNGDIETDFPLTVSGRFGPRSLRGTIGSGGRTLSLSTVNGSVGIKRQ